jgi:hypothetical protein
MAMPVEPLPYARPMDRPPRPSMFRLVITILFAAVVFVFGLGASAVFIMLFFHPHLDRALSIVPFAVAILFFYMAIRSLTVVVQFLRGKPPGENWERWVLSIWNRWV